MNRPFEILVKIIWPVVSFGLLLAGFIWKLIDPENNYAFLLYFNGWLLTLLVIGYFSTPSNSLIGKFAFGAVVIMVAGIAIKILHFQGGDVIILAGLVCLFASYAVMWLRSRNEHSQSNDTKSTND